ncbi:MAG: 2-hydroxyacyl-CoA dehydratase, partial [Candidatus Pacebacteria bacterium]|nr:2-hydroxyacyl-CoA dehydratase [Candidatus Paceibacterota bacterium]
ELGQADSIIKVLKMKDRYIKEIGNVKLNKPADCLRVGIVGELYMLMEPFSNFSLEKKLAQRNIEVHRFVTVSGILKEYFTGDFFIKQHVKDAKPYLKHHLGSHGTESVARALELAKEGFDGIIHLKPFGCMPEINAMAALSNISRDYKVPVLYFSFDSQTSEAGLETRIEAFCDMLYMKKAQSSKF